MRWEELTGDQFPQAVKDVQGVCLLPMGCIERHGHHLPMGTDMLTARELCRRAAEIEPAIIFPDYFFTQILEARHYPGTFGIEPDLLLRLLESTCREIGRNGLKKIILVNAHGGNTNLIHFFAQAQLASPRDYVVYVATPHHSKEEQAELAKFWPEPPSDHAGDAETSTILAIRPELVHMDALPSDGEGQPLGRLQQLRDLEVDTGIWWYADFPFHYAGDGRPATAEKGECLLDVYARSIARVIRVVKADREAARLQEEFFGRLQH